MILKYGMSGEAVRQAQKHLHTSAYGNFRPGVVTGKFNVKTYKATIRAKHALGYPLKECSGTYGEKLDHYLAGKGHLPESNRRRRQARIRRARVRRIGLSRKALAIALTQVGITEFPFGTNRQKYGEWYGSNGVAWCAEFGSWCFSQAGIPLHYAYVPYFVNDARAGLHGLSVTRTPRPGTAIAYDWEGDGEADHFGIFRRWIDKSRGIFEAVEGNTSLSNQSNGGQVMIRQRSTADVCEFVRVRKDKVL